TGVSVPFTGHIPKLCGTIVPAGGTVSVLPVVFVNTGVSVPFTGHIPKLFGTIVPAGGTVSVLPVVFGGTLVEFTDVPSAGSSVYIKLLPHPGGWLLMGITG